MPPETKLSAARQTDSRTTARSPKSELSISYPRWNCISVLVNRIFPRTMMISISAETARECYRNDWRRTSAIRNIDFPREYPLSYAGKRGGLDDAKRLGI